MYTRKDKTIWKPSGRPLVLLVGLCWILQMLASGYWWCCIYMNKYTYDSARPRTYSYLVPTVDNIFSDTDVKDDQQT
jgi:hypothetical protein